MDFEVDHFSLWNSQKTWAMILKIQQVCRLSFVPTMFRHSERSEESLKNDCLKIDSSGFALRMTKKLDDKDKCYSKNLPIGTFKVSAILISRFKLGIFFPRSISER